MYQRIIFPSFSFGRMFSYFKSRKQTRLTNASSAVQFRIKMTPLLEAPVRVRGNLRLPQRLASVPPLQARDRGRVCGGVELAGKQRRRPNDPRQVSWSVHTAVADVTACGERPRNLVTFLPASVYSHTGSSLRGSD